MRKLIIMLIALTFSMGLFAQENGDKASRAERKAAKEAQLAKQHAAINAAIDSRSFVIEATTFQDRYGNTVNLTPSLNFIAVDGGEATIQIVFPNNSGLGSNGLGGITLEGELVELKNLSDENDKSSRFAMRTFGSSLISGDIIVDVNREGYATVAFSNMRGGRFTLRGEFETLDNSTVYKGSVTY